MRFEKPTYARTGGEGSCPDLEDAPFCIPADGVRCCGCQWDEERGVCWRNDCDALFTPKDVRERQEGWAKPAKPQLIITAGPERSGSTWLYNAVRLLFESAQEPLDAFWLKDMSDEALNARRVGQPGSHHVLVKTHAWSDGWDLERADHVFVTHRDLRQVLASYQRLAWEADIPASYVEHHLRWRRIAELDLAFEDVIARPEALLRDLAARLGLAGRADVRAVLHRVSHLPVPKDWVDPVTQIWPSHISSVYEEARKKGAAEGEVLEQAMDVGMEPPTPTACAALERETADRLMQRFPLFFELYGYL